MYGGFFLDQEIPGLLVFGLGFRPTLVDNVSRARVDV